MACWRTKAAISLKRVKIDENLLWMAYRNLPTLFRTVSSSTPYGLLFPKIGGLQLSYSVLSQDQVKLRTSNFVGTFIVSIRTKAHENVGNSGRGRSQSPENFQGANRAHCAVIFAIAQLSCINFYHRIQRADSYMHKLLLAVDEDNFNNVGYLKISSTP